MEMEELSGNDEEKGPASDDSSDSSSDEQTTSSYEKQKLKQVSKLKKDRDRRKLKDLCTTAELFKPDEKRNVQPPSVSVSGLDKQSIADKQSSSSSAVGFKQTPSRSEKPSLTSSFGKKHGRQTPPAAHSSSEMQHTSVKETNSKQNNSSTTVRKKQGMQTPLSAHNSSEMQHTSAKETNDEQHNSSVTASKKRKRPTFKRAVIEIKFDGPMFAHKETDKGVVKLVGDRDVYVSEKDLKKAKSSCCSPSHLSRFLTRAVFSSKARGACSVSGKPSLIKGQVLAEVRTKLDQEGVEAILEYVEHRSTKKSWRVPTATAIKQYMANVLCEERAALRLAEESSAA